MSIKNLRVPSVPLITNDPYFSIWSPSDALNTKNTCHWTGREKAVYGIVKIDGEKYIFMGQCDSTEKIKQTSLEITATSSKYTFEGAGIKLSVKFTSPLLLSDLELVSRPCSYIDFEAASLDGKEHEVSVEISMGEIHCHDEKENTEMVGSIHRTSNFNSAWMGKKKQSPLCHTGDNVTIDWGYLYLAAPTCEKYCVSYENNDSALLKAVADLGKVGVKDSTAFFVTAYDDVLSIMYFGEAYRGLWADNGRTIIDAISDSISQHDMLLKKCNVFDSQLEADAIQAGGEDYACICLLSYRQTIAAHKLIRDKEGNPIFLSKECFSNGCIGTVDITYPSAPLYLIYNPELVKGMLRPVLEFAKMPVWEYDFAPHDVGRYPYACGQVYGLNSPEEVNTNGMRFTEKDVYPMFYHFPAGSDVYNLKYQMPVEECGNMLIMIAAVIQKDGCTKLAKENMHTLEKWVCYLLEYGADPGEQLCTDDFAGHLAHNVNLSAKAIMGIAAYAMILESLNRKEESLAYMGKAQRMAQDWEKRANLGDHTALTFDNNDGWSLKYNLVWDKLFNTNLFTQKMMDNELVWYKKMQKKYGVPLDNRKEYTKSDWILWCATLSGKKEDVEFFVKPIIEFLKETADRVPFSDWYDTVTAEHYHFQNRTVQGGLFMPLLDKRK